MLAYPYCVIKARNIFYRLGVAHFPTHPYMSEDKLVGGLRCVVRVHNVRIASL